MEKARRLLSSKQGAVVMMRAMQRLECDNEWTCAHSGERRALAEEHKIKFTPRAAAAGLRHESARRMQPGWRERRRAMRFN